jgi:hypothetical protein
LDTRTKKLCERDKWGHNINSEELTTIWVGWEMGCKNPYNQRSAVLLALLLESCAAIESKPALYVFMYHLEWSNVN